MSQNIKTNGVWVKASKDIISWISIIGPEIILVDSNNVQEIYLHTTIEINYEVASDDDKFTLFNKKRDKKLVFMENDIMKLSGTDCEFYYYKIGNKSKIELNNKGIFYGKWIKNNKDESYFIFKDTIDPNTEENFMTHNFEGLDKIGRWFLCNIRGFWLIELNLVELNERKLFIINRFSEEEILLEYREKNGEMKKIRLIKNIQN